MPHSCEGRWGHKNHFTNLMLHKIFLFSPYQPSGFRDVWSVSTFKIGHNGGCTRYWSEQLKEFKIKYSSHCYKPNSISVDKVIWKELIFECLLVAVANQYVYHDRFLLLLSSIETIDKSGSIWPCGFRGSPGLKIKKPLIEPLLAYFPAKNFIIGHPSLGRTWKIFKVIKLVKVKTIPISHTIEEIWPCCFRGKTAWRFHKMDMWQLYWTTLAIYNALLVSQPNT